MIKKLTKAFDFKLGGVAFCVVCSCLIFVINGYGQLPPVNDPQKLDLHQIYNPSLVIKSSQTPAKGPSPKFFEDNASDSSSGVEVQVRMDKMEFSPLERIKLRVSLKNVTKNNILLPPSGINPYLRAKVNVFNHRGELVPDTLYFSHEGQDLGVVGMTSGAGGIYLRPGITTQFTVIANLVCDMTRPGEYWLSVTIPFSNKIGRSNYGDLTPARSGLLKVKVLPESYSLID